MLLKKRNKFYTSPAASAVIRRERDIELLDSELSFIEEEHIKRIGGVSKDIENGNYRAARINRLQFTNQKHIYNRLITTFFSQEHGAALRDAFVIYMNQNPDANDASVAAALRQVYREFDVPDRDLMARAAKRATAIMNLLGPELENVRSSDYIDFGGHMWHMAQAVDEIIRPRTTTIIDVVPAPADIPKKIKYVILEDQKWPVESNSIGLITMSMVAHTMDNDALNSIASEIYRVLQPGGILIVREHNLTQTYKDTDDRRALADLFDWLYIMHSAVWEEGKLEADMNIRMHYRSFDDYKRIFTQRFGGRPLTFITAKMTNNPQKNTYNTGHIVFSKS